MRNQSAGVRVSEVRVTNNVRKIEREGGKRSVIEILSHPKKNFVSTCFNNTHSLIRE